jgi:hypothetical protein
MQLVLETTHGPNQKNQFPWTSYWLRMKHKKLIAATSLTTNDWRYLSDALIIRFKVYSSAAYRYWLSARISFSLKELTQSEKISICWLHMPSKIGRSNWLLSMRGLSHRFQSTLLWHSRQWTPKHLLIICRSTVPMISFTCILPIYLIAE